MSTDESRKARNDRRIEEVARAAADSEITILAGAGASRAETDEAFMRQADEAQRRIGQGEQIPTGEDRHKDHGKPVPLYRNVAEELYPEDWQAWKAKHGEEKPGKFFDTKNSGPGKDPELREKIAALVGKGDASSRLHVRILRLLSRTARPVVLTTNWDQRLEHTARRRAILLGMTDEETTKEEDKIRHLHGCVCDPEKMIVCDDDMKEHWSQEAHVQDFTMLMDQGAGEGRKRKVLLVGYSLEDTMLDEIMNKHRAQEAETPGQLLLRIYAIVEEQSEKRLQELEGKWGGVEAITYGNADGRHQRAVEILDRILTREEEMSAARRKLRLEQIGREGPNDETPRGEVAQVFQDGGGDLEHLLREAKPQDWASPEALEWTGIADALRAPWPNEAQRTIYGWLVNQLDGPRIEVVFGMLKASGADMPLNLRHVFGIWLGQAETPLTPMHREEAGLRMLEHGLRTGLHDMDIVMLGNTAKICREAGRDELALQTLEAVAQQNVGGVCDNPTAHMFWRETGVELVEEHGERVWKACTKALRAQHEAETQVTGHSSREGGISRGSYRRSAIEDHEQDEMDRESLTGMLIEGAREAIEHAGRSHGGNRKAWEQWGAEAEAEDSPLLRRIGIHAVRLTGHWSPDEKIEWLVETNALSASGLKHETYHLLAEAWQGASAEVRTSAARAVAELTLAGLKLDDPERIEEYNDRTRFELIEWLKAHGARHELLEAELARVKGAHPEWRQGEHPDFLHWSSGAFFVDPRPPQGWTPEKLIKAWKDKGEAGLAEVIDRDFELDSEDPAEDWVRRQDPQGERDAIRAAMGRDLGWGVALCDALAAKGVWEHPGWRAMQETAAEDLASAHEAGMLDKNWWDGLLSNGQERIVADFAEAAARGAKKREEMGPAEQTLQDKVLQWLPRCEKDSLSGIELGWMGWTINTPTGKCVEATLMLAATKGISKSERQEILDELKALWRRGGTQAKHVAIHAASRLPWLETLSPGWTDEIVAQPLADAGERGQMRSVIWGGLAFANWGYEIMVSLMKPALVQELSYGEGANEYGGGGNANEGRVKDPAARSYGRVALGNILFGGGRWGEGLERAGAAGKAAGADHEGDLRAFPAGGKGARSGRMGAGGEATVGGHPRGRGSDTEGADGAAPLLRASVGERTDGVREEVRRRPGSVPRLRIQGRGERSTGRGRDPESLRGDRSAAALPQGRRGQGAAALEVVQGAADPEDLVGGGETQLPAAAPCRPDGQAGNELRMKVGSK